MASEMMKSGPFAAATFTSKLHHQPDELDPSKVELPTPFVVCILGAGRNIGAGTALSYVKAGASGIVLAARGTKELEETAAKCKALNSNVHIEIIQCDVTSSESVAALAKQTKEMFGRLDAAVVNAAYSGPFILKITETDPELYQTTINVNYIGTVHSAKYLIPLLLETRDGAKSFIAVTSLGALTVRGPVSHAHYNVSKAAQVRLVENIHEQYVNGGLSAFALHPGSVAGTELSKDAPAAVQPMLQDSPDLCGAFCVWLTKDAQKRAWLSGRMLSANWDVDELEGKKDEIVEKDLLKLKLLVQ